MEERDGFLYPTSPIAYLGEICFFDGLTNIDYYWGEIYDRPILENKNSKELVT